MELSLRRLRMLRELHRRGTVTAAANALHYSPSGISQQLAQLEREVGVRLVERRGRGLQLTELGLVLSEHAEEVLASVERATNALSSAQAGINVRLTGGVWASVAAGLVPAALTRLAVDHPGIEVRTTELPPEETAGAVSDGNLDFSFGIDYSVHPMPWQPTLTREVIAVERLHVAAPAGTIPGATLGLSALAESPWILAGPRSHFGRAVRIACQAHGFEPPISHEVEEQSTSLAMVAGGLGVTLVSDLALLHVPDGVDIIALDEPVMRTVSIVYRSTSPLRQSLKLVVDAVRVAAAEAGLAASSDVPASGAD